MGPHHMRPPCCIFHCLGLPLCRTWLVSCDRLTDSAAGLQCASSRFVLQSVVRSILVQGLDRRLCQLAAWLLAQRNACHPRVIARSSCPGDACMP